MTIDEANATCLCSRCHGHTSFDLDEFGDVVSECCFADPLDPSSVADSEDK